MPSQNLFSGEIEVSSKVLSINKKLEGDVNCVVWDAALVLRKYLEVQCLIKKLSLERVNVVKLGTGLGCVGLSAACLGANVVLTDLKEAIPLLETNIVKNLETIKSANGNAVAKVCNCGSEFSLNVKPDLILLQIAFIIKWVSLLVKTLVHLSTPTTKILLSQEETDSEIQRINWHNFVKMIEKHFIYLKFLYQNNIQNT